jgi:hypothetical protein
MASSLFLRTFFFSKGTGQGSLLPLKNQDCLVEWAPCRDSHNALRGALSSSYVVGRMVPHPPPVNAEH